MPNKKKTRKGKKKKKLPNTFYLICLLLLVTAVAIGLFLSLSSSPIRTHSLPVYEEVSSKSTDLQDKIRLIDHTIYESLYQSGVEQKDIFFAAVRPRNKNHHEWEFTEMIIRLKDEDSVLRFKNSIHQALSGLQQKINVQDESLSGGEHVCNIYTMDLYTHRIRLIKKEDKRVEGGELPRIAIIIDDMGYDKELASSFIKIDLPLCLSILPLAPFTESIAQEAGEKGRELLLHLPMEPKGYPGLDPGPGALLMDMSAEEVKKRIDLLVKKVPGLKGVNHHMGSCYTESVDKMELVLRELKKRNLFYVDSRTTKCTVAFDVAKKLGVPVAKKSVFLDHEPSQKAIRFQMERLLGVARYSGTAVGIGHPHKQTLEIINEYQEQLKRDFKVVPVSELVS